MGKCNRCGKGGWFFKINSNGMCQECERIAELEAHELQLQKSIAIIQNSIATENKNYIDIKEKRQSLYDEIADQAKRDALSQIANEISLKRDELQAVIDQIDDKKKALENLLEQYSQSERATLVSADKLRKIQTLHKSMQYSAKQYLHQQAVVEDIMTDNSLKESEDLLSTTIKLKLHLMDIRELRKLYNQNNQIIQQLLRTYQTRYTTKANITIYQLMVIALEAELQNVLYNMKYSKLEKAIEDIKTITAKYQKISTTGNQSIAPTVTKFIGEIEYLFIEAIKIEYEYYIQKERIKEEQRMLREQARQEAAERKLLREERLKVEQEEQKFRNEITNITEQLTTTQDAQKIQQLEERIARIQAQLSEVEKRREDIIRLQKGKAGYIYIISNLGSFGENIFKIGMTRRINPQERVDELGNASLPFNFDVHSFIFSENAPELEYNLHKTLHKKRINKVNMRKEFFNTTIDELEDLVYTLEPSAEFNRSMLAEHYYQSMTIQEVPESITIINDDEENEYDEADQA